MNPSLRLPWIWPFRVGSAAALVFALAVVLIASGIAQRRAVAHRAQQQLVLTREVARILLVPEATLRISLDDALAEEIARVSRTSVVFVDTTILGDPNVLGSSLPRTADVVALAREHRVLRADREVPTRATVDGIGYFVDASLATVPDGAVQGIMITLWPSDPAWYRGGIVRAATVLAIVVAAVVVFVLTLQLERRATEPLDDIAQAARCAASGDATAGVKLAAEGPLSDLALAVQAVIDRLAERRAAAPADVDLDAARTSAQYPSPAADLEALRSSGHYPPATVEVAARTSTGLHPALASTRVTAAIQERVDGTNLAEGQVFADRFEILEKLGTSPVRTAYKVRDRELDEEVTLKTLNEDLFTGDIAAVERFRADLRVARRLSHPNILRTYDFGEWAGIYYVTMEQVEVTPLRQIIDRRGRLTLKDVLSVGIQVNRALAIAHKDGVIHRDIRPESLLIDKDGRLKLADFGMASPAHRTRARVDRMDPRTLAYVAPEVLRADPIDHRADLYSVGVVVYECLAGQIPAAVPPSPAPAPVDTLNPEAPAALSALLSRVLSPQPEDRPANATEFGELLSAIS
ncbi:MAG: protein kinase [Gemmatimonadales bacterium]|nr:protein kinase [Gemmatimonadales bacterium]